MLLRLGPESRAAADLSAPKLSDPLRSVRGMIIVSTAAANTDEREQGWRAVWSWVDHVGGSGTGRVAGSDECAHLHAVLDALQKHPGTEPLMIESGSAAVARLCNGQAPAHAADVRLDEALVKSVTQALRARQGPVRIRWARGGVLSHYQASAQQLAGRSLRAPKLSGTACSNGQHHGPRGTLASC